MADKVLRDLFAFCYVHKPTVMVSKSGQVDPLASMVAAGRQEAGLRLVEMLHLKSEYITNLRRRTYDDGSD